MNVVWFVFQLIILFFISKKATHTLFEFLRRFIKNERLIFYLIAAVYLPGTILHEISHFFAALALFLPVREINILPQIQGREIKLGWVVYEKQDFFRGFLVGIAPFFVGLFLFYIIDALRLFSGQPLWLTAVFTYLVFILSSTMFSSKQDLVDFLYVAPFLLLLTGLFYLFRFDIGSLLNHTAIAAVVIEFIKSVNSYLLFSISVNIGLILILRATLYILR